LAAGVLNQVEVELDLDGQPRRLALKGTTEHVVTHSVETEGDHVYNVTRRTPEASLKVLDLDTGKIETVTPANPRFAEIVQEALPALLERLKADVEPVFTELADADREVL